MLAASDHAMSLQTGHQSYEAFCESLDLPCAADDSLMISVRGFCAGRGSMLAAKDKRPAMTSNSAN